MPPERVKRQEPVSCQQCRRKKLRCDRQLPCANCRSRDTHCAYSSQRGAIDVASQQEASPAEWTDLHHLRAENTDIRARLRTLENVVLQGQVGREDSLPPASASRQSTSTPLRAASSDSESVLHWTGESRLLEPVGAEDSSRTPDLTKPVLIRILTLQEMIGLASLSANKDDAILIPTLEEVNQLTRLYVERSDTLQHIIHLGSVTTIFCRLYDQLHQGLPYKFSHVALVLGITATIAKTWDHGSRQSSIDTTPRIAIDMATYCTRSALDMLEQAWRSQSADVVTIQSYIVLAFLLYHTEAFSPNVRYLLSSAITLAKDIGLHMTDNIVVEDELAQSRDEIIETEMRRRIWWHLTALDWNLSLNGGPHEGTYNINPRHIRVRKPRNIGVEDLATMPANFSRPLSEATTMSYYLHCIPIGEVCREVADITWDLSGSDLDSISYTKTILSLDKRFDGLLGGLPQYLSMERTSEESETVPKAIEMQRHLVNLTIYARRCKLHLPFLLRAAHNQHYKFSRTTCLKAARSILSLRSCVFSSRITPPDQVNLRLVGILRHFFCALVVLVVDLCVNRAAGQETERKAEIKLACTIFEDAKKYSASAGYFLDALVAVIHSNKARFRTQDLVATQGTTSLSDLVMSETPAIDQGGVQFNLGSESFPSTQPGLGFDDLWQTYFDAGAIVHPQEWDALFAQLDTSIQ